ncbi:galactose oxidase/kelch repeat superfamily protein [Tasmannia lanceolata]|uniref:galactose oxidase/kelch repeat superfamily protein n=1 Tax=Tasmannia lanceolata TaxID=3420 RepID=UPI004062FE34
MNENCNSRGLTWLVKSCFPNPQPEIRRKATGKPPFSSENPPNPTISSLPDDLLIECLSRVSSSSLSSLSLVCRRWSQILCDSSFYNSRRSLGRLRQTVYALAVSDFGLFSATHRIGSETSWKTSPFPGTDTLQPEIIDGSFSCARLTTIGPSIYILCRYSTFRYDTWTKTASPRSPMLHPRKKFAVATVAGKIYAAGGNSAVEEYDPARDTWRVVAESPRKRHGCIGAGIDGIFYVIGGLRICSNRTVEVGTRGGRIEAHVYASSMDLYDVEGGTWLRSRHVPGGGCVVAACASGGFVYVLASHAVEMSFWRYDGRRGSLGFGEWCRLKSPPVPAQVRLDGAVRFCCVGFGERVVLVQVVGSIDDLLRRSGRSCRGFKEGLVLVYDGCGGDWTRGPDLPEIFRRATCVSVEC